MSDRLHVLVVESYFGGSHGAWATGLQRASTHDVHIIGLEDRWWKWRMRGGAVTLAERALEHVAAHGRPDVLVVSDMIDLPAFLAFSHPVWGRIPTILYFHETQLTYPDSPRAEPDMSFAFTNWTSALIADRVVFNSDYHLGVFFDELPRLLRHFPDHTHEHRIPEVEAKAEVLPVGFDPVDPSGRSLPPLVLWNHRWEHDKAPGVFVAALRNLLDDGLEFRVAVTGFRPPQAVSEAVSALAFLGGKLVVSRELAVEDYREVVAGADVVVSTALQEFFGISVMEAMSAGAFPVLPDRLSYPSLIPEEVHDRVLYRDGRLGEALRTVLLSPDRAAVTAVTMPASRRFAWSELGRDYDSLFRNAATNTPL